MIARLSKLLALLCSSGFSVGLILTSVVTVESWAGMEPGVAIDWFAEFGLPLGIVMVPFGGLAMVFSAVALVSTLPSLRKTGVNWYWLDRNISGLGGFTSDFTFQHASTLGSFETGLHRLV